MKVRASIAALAIAFVGPIAATAQDDARTDIYSVDLETGAATSVGFVEESVDGMALGLDGLVYLLTDDDQLLTATIDGTGDADTAITSDTSLEITGLGDGENLIGIDIRPATDQLFAISDASIVYFIDVTTGVAVAPGAATDPAIEADALGFDFNPTVDRIRVDVSTTQNLRLNPDTGAVGTNPDTSEPTIDGNIAFAEGDENVDATPAVVGAGYTNSVADAEETQLYVIDAETDVLALQDPPNDGTLNTVGSLDVDVNGSAAFDITVDGSAFLTVSSDDAEFTEGDSGATPASDDATPASDDDEDDLDEDEDATPSAG
ncbi:MAG: hypothetical protein AVDCRST_MAG33-632 [uncultured Thermomicrobiales bacterium]|uniref:DUF4394 domain-containing protein n=1 Tax=uncultured Thermomicrobiales bacterium TaxID=1645740 RepID=A0A6J4UH89_9BACT|nr:MAG: hypothetical protein AVDCRST_MAG33-632 [uncultured Thermomicrobiales bacterium]